MEVQAYALRCINGLRVSCSIFFFHSYFASLFVFNCPVFFFFIHCSLVCYFIIFFLVFFFLLFFLFCSCQILVTDKKIDQVNDLLPLLEAMVQAKEPLLIVAEDVVGEALSALVVNKMRGVLDVVAVKAPSFGERRKNYLQDIAIATGSTYIAEEVGLTLDQVSP